MAISNKRMERAEIVFRIGLIGAGCLLVYTSFNIFTTGNIAEFPLTVLLLIGSGLAGLVLLGAAMLPKMVLPPWIILVVFLANGLIMGLIWMQTMGVTRVGRPVIGLSQTDSALYTEMAAGLLLRGHNPYDWDYSAAMATYRMNEATSTPTLLGSQESPFPYPPLTILLTAPFLAIGLPSVFCLIFASYLALLVLVYRLSPRLLAPIVLLPFAIGFANDLAIFSLIGVTDMVWVVLLVAMAAYWERPILTAILFGIAATCKQSPWLIAPFLVVRLYAEQPDWRRGMIAVMRFGVVSGLVFLIINLPFMIPAPRLWAIGVLEPLIDTLVMFGQNSPVNLTQYGYLYLPKQYFLIASMIALLVIGLIYWRHFRRLRDVVWLLPGIYMWFSYRTLTTYWTFWAFPALLAIYRWQIHDKTVLKRPASWRLTVALAIVGLLLIIGVGAAMALPPQMKVQVHAPIIVGLDGRVNEMTVEVENTSQRPVTPRFAVHQASFSANPLIWQVLSGLPQIAPGTRNTYRIAPRGSSNSFYGHDLVQVLVTDAQDYTLRATTLIGEQSLLWPDAIPNPHFTMWNYAASSPILWESIIDAPGRIEMVTRDQEDVLSLVLAGVQKKPDERFAALESQIIFPDAPFWINYLTDPDFPLEAQVGIELDDGTRTKRLPFVPTQGKWSKAEINLAQIYQTESWQRPPLKRTVFRGLELPFRLIKIRLFVWADAGNEAVVQAYFKNIESPDYSVPPERLMQETLNDPASYYLRLGDDLTNDGNYQRAAAAYQRGLDYKPTDSELTEKLNRALQASREIGAP